MEEDAYRESANNNDLEGGISTDPASLIAIQNRKMKNDICFLLIKTRQLFEPQTQKNRQLLKTYMTNFRYC